jgi:hypothetical protein
MAISIACFTGAMDEVSGGDCMAERMLNRSGGGFVGVMMNSRYGWGAIGQSGNYVMGPSEMIDTTFLNRVLRQGAVRQGQALASAKNAWVPYADSSYQYDMMRWCLYELNLFGDPELPLWTNDPESLQVTHNPVVPMGTSELSVTVQDKNSGSPIQGALVCLMPKSGSSYDWGTTDASGQATLGLTVTAVETVYVTVTGRDHYPSEGFAMVQANGPYVAHLRHGVDDGAGNGDGIANPGESIALPTWVKNYGSQATAGSVVCTLKTASPYASLTESVHEYGAMAAGESLEYSPGFEFVASASCTNGVSIPFTLVSQDGDTAWSSGFSVTVGTAVLEYGGRTIDGNGRLDPNETAAVVATVANGGLGNGYNVAGVLRCSDVRVTVTDSVAGFGTIGHGGSGNNAGEPFQLSLGTLPVGTPVTFTLVMKADGVVDRSASWSENVGDVRYAPSGPDAGGYYAVEDSDGVSRAPVYQWTEIHGAGGTQVSPGDDGRALVSLPFNFTWYGASYNQVSICGNGWVGLGSVTAPTYYESHVHLPNNAANVPRPTVFALWDDVDPSTGGWVGYYHDAANARFIIEYDAVPFYGTSSYSNTFQVILYDSTGGASDGCLGHDVVLQYKTWQDRGQSGIGAQNAAGNNGLDLYYNGAAGNSGNLVGMNNLKAVRLTKTPNTGVAGGSGIAAKPLSYELGRSFPNPVRGECRIEYQLPAAGRVSLRVYNIAGQLVRTLVDEFRAPGLHVARWDGRDQQGRQVSAGVYLYRLATPGFTKTRKVTMVR